MGEGAGVDELGQDKVVAINKDNNGNIQVYGLNGGLVLTKADFERAMATDEETEGFVNEMLSIDSVEIAAILREPKPGRIRCSLRSRGDHDVAAVAREFGGGGHRNAAGCTLDMPIDEAEEALVRRLRACLAS